MLRHKMNPNIQEIRGTDSWNFETLKYIISNESNDILLDNAYDPDWNLDTVYVLPEAFYDSLEKQWQVTFQFSNLIFEAKVLKVS